MLDGMGLELDDLLTEENDPGLGNGGLGRLAACFLDSMATLALPGRGYGIRYEYGMFKQNIVNGQQAESPDYWLEYGNPWEFPRHPSRYKVRFGGRLQHEGAKIRWVETEEVLACAYDQIIPGFDTDATNTLRLWSAQASREINLGKFNQGDYFAAVEDKNYSENVSRVLYPYDSTYSGRELRLRQEYFLVSATVQDILNQHWLLHSTFDNLGEKIAIHLNDTHPVLAIPELMRLLIDEHKFDWSRAWAVVCQAFSYTNHTLMSEALETWPVDMLGKILPRHLQIIFDINDHFLNQVQMQVPGDSELLSRVYIIDKHNGRMVRMAWLAVIASHKVNGVSELHSELMVQSLFADFARLFPDRFCNKTNGVTPRRWLALANPPLSSSLFDVQIKRIHEYKRQLLNVLHIITRYNRIRENPDGDWVPRVNIFAGKAASAYYMAKHIIRLINDVAAVINRDPLMKNRLKVIFVPNYSVSLAQLIIPAADLSEQISLAGTEASGTSNMKFALNGALTIGTLDGANIEMRQHMGEENMFIFGNTALQVEALRSDGYNPRSYYEQDAELHLALSQIATGLFSPGEPGRYGNLFDSLVNLGDHYQLLADYRSYVDTQEEVDRLYQRPDEWTRRAALNIANMGYFSADRTIREYAEEIWKVAPIRL